MIDYLIVKEVTSKEYYTKKYTRGEWPKGNSGITIGIGYDLGHQSKEQIAKDWAEYVSPGQLKNLQYFSGFTGPDAQAKLHRANQLINIPWDIAYKVFTEKSLPLWINKVTSSLPNTDLLNDDCLGVLVSLAYNRGPAWNVPKKNDKTGKYEEMRNIKLHMENKEFNKIPDELRAMKRLWTLKGLLVRRDEEARLFEAGLGNPDA